MLGLGATEACWRPHSGSAEQGRCSLRRDNQEALRLYKLAADQGNTWAQAAFARLEVQAEEQERQREAADRDAEGRGRNAIVDVLAGRAISPSIRRLKSSD